MDQDARRIRSAGKKVAAPVWWVYFTLVVAALAPGYMSETTARMRDHTRR